jgi:hypothetical protein
VETYVPIGEGFVSTGVESSTTQELVLELAKFESKFDSRSRTKNGAKDLMDPMLSIDRRWAALLEFSSNISGLRGVLNNKVTSENDKKTAISTVSQYMRKASNFDN